MSVVCAALIPAAPLLVPALTGQRGPAQDLRDAALACINELIDDAPAEIIVAAEATPTGWHSPTAPLRLDRLGGIGLNDGDDTPLPIPLAIGAALLIGAGWNSPVRFLALDEGGCLDIFDPLERTGLLLLANGSARCTDKAPGALHPGAEAFNAAALNAITTCDSQALLSIDASTAREQWSDLAGPALLLATLVDTPPEVTVRYAGVEAGVQYYCTTMLWA